MISESISKRVLFVGTSPDGKGGIASVIKLYSAIMRRFRCVCSHRSAGRIIQAWLAFQAAWKVLWYCLFGGIKVVHIHTASYRAFFRESTYLMIAKLLSKRVILHLHGGEFELFFNKHPRYCRYICRKANAMIGVSNAFAELYRRLALNDNIIVIYNAVEKPMCGEKIKVEDGGIRVLFLGAIDDNKGIFDVVECFAKNKEHFAERKITLDICGVGESDRLIKEIEKWRLGELIRYQGWVEKERKNELLSKADIYIQPSYFESFGIAIVEAMGYGVPVIASNTGGVPEIVKDMENGFLIEPGNIDQLNNRLILLADNAVMRDRMGKSAEATADMFSIGKLEERLAKLYNSMI